MEKILDLQNQSSLAKLLATENISVTHRNDISTAYFDIKHRVLGLPMWKDQGKVVYDMLVGHEVSHALYTPAKQFEDFIQIEGRKYFDILNIIEDIRIERLIKKKYASMPRIFNGAYNTLVEKDFFNIADKDISKMCFLDRLNLKAKIGTIVDIPLNVEEEALYNECYAAETFEEVIELYHKVKEFAKKEAEEKQNKSRPQPQPNVEESSEESESNDLEDENDFFSESDNFEDSSDEEDDGTQSHTKSSEDKEDEDDNDEESQKTSWLEDLISEEEDTNNASASHDGAGATSDTNGEDVILEPTTTKSLEENLIEKNEDRSLSNKPLIALFPTKNTIKKHVIDYKTVMSKRRSVTDMCRKTYFNDEETKTYINDLAVKVSEFKNKTNKKVSVLTREFERRKAAYQYSRAQESRRGTLDVNNLHKYKYDDQIFQSVLKLADAKSHGMIFFIDYSGSMGNVLKDVLEHTLNLVHFCKKVSVPFKVYSFTSNYALDKMDKTQSEMEIDMQSTVIAELFSSEMTKSEYNKAFEQVSQQIIMSNQDSFSQGTTSPFEHLGGTPLDHTIMAAHYIVDEFRKKHQVQKLNVIFLTDGESQRANPIYDRYTYGRKMLMNVGGKQCEVLPNSSTKTHLEIFKKTKGVNTIGFYLPSDKRWGTNHLKKMNNYSNVQSALKLYKKEKYYHKNDCFGYDSYFLLSSDIEIEDTEFTYEKSEGKSISDNRGEQSKLAREFAKHNIANKTNRIIMAKFAEAIA